MTTISNTAWVTNDRRNRDSSSQGQTAPVKGFNVQETRDALKKAYTSMSLEDLKLLRYKPGTSNVNVKTSAPWASKSNTMSNGKDFFLELRKQVSSMQHSGERAGG